MIQTEMVLENVKILEIVPFVLLPITEQMNQVLEFVKSVLIIVKVVLLILSVLNVIMVGI